MGGGGGGGGGRGHGGRGGWRLEGEAFRHVRLGGGAGCVGLLAARTVHGRAEVTALETVTAAPLTAVVAPVIPAAPTLAPLEAVAALAALPELAPLIRAALCPALRALLAAVLLLRRGVRGRLRGGHLFCGGLAAQQGQRHAGVLQAGRDQDAARHAARRRQHATQRSLAVRRLVGRQEQRRRPGGLRRAAHPLGQLRGRAGHARQPQRQRRHVPQRQRHAQVAGRGGHRGGRGPRAEQGAQGRVAVPGQGHAVAVHDQSRALRQPVPTGRQRGVHDHGHPGAAGALQLGRGGFQQPHGARAAPVGVHARGSQPGGGQRLAADAHAGVHPQRARAQVLGQLAGQGGLVAQQQAPRGALQVGERPGEAGVRIAPPGVQAHEPGVRTNGSHGISHAHHSDAPRAARAATRPGGLPSRSLPARSPAATPGGRGA
ncbi:hypothetical protein DEGR_25980 [Deinococcus grandis]|nr:hypothetical protein DEGR_25980 [Deinococcus grandis]